MTTGEHEWPDPPTEHNECIHCGTWRAYHETKQQNCVPRWNPADAPRRTSTGRSVGDFAADDSDFIRTRLAELEAERVAALNQPAESSCAAPSDRSGCIAWLNPLGCSA